MNISHGGLELEIFLHRNLISIWLSLIPICILVLLPGGKFKQPPAEMIALIAVYVLTDSSASLLS